MVDEYEVKLDGTRGEIAAVLRDVADGLVAGSVRLGEGADAINVDVPDELALEIELESGDDDVDLELEVEWERPASGDDGITAIEAPDGETEIGFGDDASAASDPRGQVEDSQGGDAAAASEEGSSPVAAADGSRTLEGFEIFRDRAGEWRWRLRHRNGNVIATSGEGYTRKHSATKGLRSVMRNAPEAEVVEETDG